MGLALEDPVSRRALRRKNSGIALREEREGVLPRRIMGIKDGNRKINKRTIRGRGNSRVDP